MTENTKRKLMENNQKRRREENVLKRITGERLTNLERLMETLGDGEDIPDEERGICYPDLLAARTYFGTLASWATMVATATDDLTISRWELSRLTDAQLYKMWRAWIARERRVVETSTFAGWLESTDQ